MNPILKYYLPVYLGLFFLATFVFTGVLFYLKNKTSPVVFSTVDNAYNYIGRLMILLILLVAIATGFYCSGERWYQLLAPFPYLESHYARLVGLVFIHVSLLWVVTAQLQMGRSWRIGIDVANKTSLVDTGIFRFSRNPIYLGICVSFSGLFLIMPNSITLLVLVLGFAVINIQIRLEEEFLTKMHGNAYEQYKMKVRRWL